MDEILSGKTIKQWQDEATAAERERCAKIALLQHLVWDSQGDDCAVCDDESACVDIAAAIRKDQDNE